MSDLKKGLLSADRIISDQTNADESISGSQLKTSAPAFERVRRGNDGVEEEGEKVCRICLEEDSPETMIAPCLCKGGSKWVHRECLDEWRTNERDRAFSKCTECLFEYHLQPVYLQQQQDEERDLNCCSSCIPCTPQQRRRALFYWMISRDACLGIILQQIIVVLLAVLVLACDSNHQLPSLLLRMEDLSGNKLVWVYYGFGWFAFFISLGLYGSIIMCTNGCDVNRAIPNLGPPSEADEESPGPAQVGQNPTRNIPNRQYNYSSYQNSQGNSAYYDSPRDSCSSSTMFYRRARRRHYHHRHSSYWYDDHYCYPSYYYYPMYIGNDDSCCCCCCCNPIGHHHHGGCCGGSSNCCPGSMHSAIGSSRGTSFSGGSGSSGNSSEGQHILLMILLVVAIILAVIGFFVGVVIVVVAAQKIVGRHIYLLQKRQLVQEFQVVDLQDYDLDQPISTTPIEQTMGSGIELREGVSRHPPPSAPVMPTEDVQYLKKLGLMDR